MNNVIYREATINDCYQIAKLKGEVWNTTYRSIYPDSMLDNYDIEKNKITFEKIISNPQNTLFVAIFDDKIIGFMNCGEPYRPYLHFKQEMGLLYILQEYQRKGIGTRLFSIAKEVIKNKGYNEFFISVNKYNIGALNFYVAMGGIIISIDEENKNKYQTQIKISFTI